MGWWKRLFDRHRSAPAMSELEISVRRSAAGLSRAEARARLATDALLEVPAALPFRERILALVDAGNAAPAGKEGRAACGALLSEALKAQGYPVRPGSVEQVWMVEGYLDRLFEDEVSALQREQGFPQGFWHPEDTKVALDVMLDGLSQLGLAAAATPPAQTLRTLIEGVDAREDEDVARRHQIGLVLERVNQALAARGDQRRFRAFAEDLPSWEPEEPVWLLLTPAEREQLLGRGVLRPPSGLEQEYDQRISESSRT